VKRDLVQTIWMAERLKESLLWSSFFLLVYMVLAFGHKILRIPTQFSVPHFH
jgi:hypothetical protein